MAARSLILSIVLALTSSHWKSLEAPPFVVRVFSSRPALQDMEKKPVTRESYVGDEICGSCHKDKLESFLNTSHHLTSRQASADVIAGSFVSGANILRTSNPGLFFRMEAKDGRFYQTAVWGTPPNEKTRTHSLDLVIGSGGQGQSYLYWDDDQLFGLPVGYSTLMRRWINGPGYVDGTATFDRGIIPRCLECHAAYFESKFPSADSNVYNTTNFVLGISCERCHGPGRGHVEMEERGTAAKATRRSIVNPAKLSSPRR